MRRRSPSPRRCRRASSFLPARYACWIWSRRRTKRQRSIARSLHAACVCPGAHRRAIQIEVVLVATDLHVHLQLAGLAPSVAATASPDAKLLEQQKILGPVGNRQNASARWKSGMLPACSRSDDSLIAVTPALELRPFEVGFVDDTGRRLVEEHRAGIVRADRRGDRRSRRPGECRRCPPASAGCGRATATPVTRSSAIGSCVGSSGSCAAPDTTVRRSARNFRRSTSFSESLGVPNGTLTSTHCRVRGCATPLTYSVSVKLLPMRLYLAGSLRSTM